MLVQITGRRIATPTGSKIHRVWKCPASIVLPQVDDEEDSPAAGRGREIHTFLENAKKPGVGREAALAMVSPEVRLMCELLNVDELPAHLSTEVAFLYDYKRRTARDIGHGIGRDYDGHLARTNQEPRRPTEIALTIDLAGGATLADGRRRGYVGDYKSGRSKLPSPDKFGQTLLAALALSKVFQTDDCVLELIYLRGDGTNYVARRTLDTWDLDTFGDELEAAMGNVFIAAREYEAGRDVDVVEGPHCEYCPAFKRCPAKIALVRSIPAELASLGLTPEVFRGEVAAAPDSVFGGGGLTRANAPSIWMITERIKDVLNRLQDEICGLGAYGDIELPDGRVIGRLITERDSIDGKIAASLIEQWFGAAARDKAVELKVTKDAVREAVVAHVAERAKAGEKLVIQSKHGTGLLDRTLAELRARGGIEKNVTDSVKPHVRRKLKA